MEFDFEIEYFEPEKQEISLKTFKLFNSLKEIQIEKEENSIGRDRIYEVTEKEEVEKRMKFSQILTDLDRLKREAAAFKGFGKLIEIDDSRKYIKKPSKLAQRIQQNPPKRQFYCKKQPKIVFGFGKKIRFDELKPKRKRRKK